MNLKALLADYLANQMTHLLAMQNPDGSFGPFRFSNADYPFHTMAYLYKKMPGCSWFGSARLLEALIRILEFHALDKSSVLWTEEDFPEGIRHGGWRLRIPKRRAESVSVKWPCHPYNSYRADRKSDISAAALIASAQLFPGESSIEYEIEIENTVSSHSK